jgi:hypothetical protein
VKWIGTSACRHHLWSDAATFCQKPRKSSAGTLFDSVTIVPLPSRGAACSISYE